MDAKKETKKEIKEFLEKRLLEAKLDRTYLEKAKTKEEILHQEPASTRQKRDEAIISIKAVEEMLEEKLKILKDL